MESGKLWTLMLFQTIIGNIDLVTPHTGETSRTSAASVVLFDKDTDVLWKAP